jgi:hypothetical protein
MTPQTQAGSVQHALSAPVGRDIDVQNPSLLRRIVIFPLKLVWGMLFCQTLTGSIFVVGWTYRLAQRSALKFWFSQSDSVRAGSTFTQFLAGMEMTRLHLHWPNWFARQNFRDAARFRPELSPTGYLFRIVRALVDSLWMNFWIGLRGILNIWVLTLPACVLWWFGWYDGWNNSFNKGYEQAAVGPLISLLGIALFIAAMFYLPMAQARQAVTADWRSFYQFRLIVKLAKDRWMFCVLLAVLYSLLGIPLSILKTSPTFWMHNSQALGSLTTAQVAASLKNYFFWCALVMFPSFVIVHLAAARIYASGLAALVRTGRISASELAPFERDVFDRLCLTNVQPESQRHALLRVVAWTSSRLAQVAGRVALVLIWFSFVAQIYISEFFNYHSGLGWMNQPLVQLPWFRYLPHSVRNPWADISSAFLIVLVAILIRSIARSLRIRAK